MVKVLKLTCAVLVIVVDFTFAQFTTYPVNRQLSWNSTLDYDSYEYDEMHFRLMEPNGFSKGANGGQKFPLIVFFHGAGEVGSDNDKQLKHGGQTHRDAVNTDEFPGLLLYPQLTTNTNWNLTSRNKVRNIIYSLIEFYDVDPTRIYIHGLSMGGGGTWRFLSDNLQLVATAYPMADSGPEARILIQEERTKYTPIWYSQGGKDGTTYARPYHGNFIINHFRDIKGGEIRYLYFPDKGHGVWNATYAQEDFFTNMLAKNKTYPVVLDGHSSFCPGEGFIVTIGVSPGMDGYQWQRSDDNIVWNDIIGATSNELEVEHDGLGVGYYRVKLYYDKLAEWGTEWNGVWTNENNSIAVHINTDEQPTPTPTISSRGKSVNLPALDGSTSVDLLTDVEYDNYQWYLDDVLIPGQNVNPYQNISIAGEYTLSTWSNAGETFFWHYNANYDFDGATPPEDEQVPVENRADPPGCPSEHSNPVAVTTENGLGVPNAPNNFFVTATKADEIKIDWDDNSDNENGFEVYRATLPGGPYEIILLSSPMDQGTNPQFFVDTGLLPGTTYYYSMRAVNNNGGSSYTPERSATTLADNEAPTPPILALLSSNRSEIGLTWSGATDNVGVHGYEIYRNGTLTAVVDGSESSYTFNGLTPFTLYTFYIHSKDLYGNTSIRSNQISAATINNGLNYDFYTNSGISSVNQIISSGTLVKQGFVSNFDISVRTQNDNFGFVFYGYINIPSAGNYRFFTSSDDGSQLFIDGGLTVDNDGLHACNEKSSSWIFLNEGPHEFRLLMFENGGGECLEARWEGPGFSKQLIPDDAFQDEFDFPTLPLGPSVLTAIPSSGTQVDLTWSDNSNDETGFEILRSTEYASGYTIVGTVDANEISYSDQTVDPVSNYFYKIISSSATGSSGILNSNFKSFLNFEGDIDDNSPNALSSVISGSGISYLADQQMGNQSIQFDGNGFIDFDNGNNFIHDEFFERSFACWIKPNNPSNNNQVIFEEGGSTNGIGVQIKNGKIEAAVQDNHTIELVTSATSVTTDWMHIAVIFDHGVFKLFINGQLEDSESTSYSEVSGHSNGAGLGASNSSNAFDNNGIGYAGLIDAFYIYELALSDEEVNALFSNANIATVTTLDPIAAPLAPANLIATLAAGPAIQLAWDDIPTDELGFEIERSTSSTGPWTLIASLPAETDNYLDSDVNGNSTYYYRVVAIGIEQNSNYSNIASATTVNNLPVFNNLSDVSVNDGESTAININATDPDGDPISLSVLNLPGFGSFTDLGNGQGVITLTAATGGPVFTVQVFADDGTETSNESFDIIISSNADPVLVEIEDQTMFEGATLNLTINATDPDNPTNNLNVVVLGSSTAAGTGASNISNSWVGKLESWLPNSTITNLAEGGQDTRDVISGGGSKDIDDALAISPDIIILNLPSNDVANDIPATETQSNYQSIIGAINTHNGNNGTDIQFFITTTQPRTQFEQTKRDQLVAEASWIRSEFGAFAIDIYDELADENDAIKAVYDAGDDIHLNDAGHNYIYQKVKKKLIQRTSLEGLYFEISNMPSFASFIDNVDGSAEILFTPDLTQAGTYANIQVFVHDGVGGSDSEAFSLVVENDNSLDPPLVPTGLVATAEGVDQIRLDWTDNSEDEDGFDVYRATSFAGPFTKINATLLTEGATYTDNDGLLGHTTYYYQVVAVKNATLESPSNVTSASTFNNLPIISEIASIFVNIGETQIVELDASDIEDDPVTLFGSNLPAFVRVIDNGDGTGSLIVEDPQIEDIGSYGNLRVIAEDNFGGRGQSSFFIIVGNIQFSETLYLNFGETPTASDPWNNLNHGSTTYSNLLNTQDAISNISVEVVNGWESASDAGYIDPNNNGIYENQVMESSWSSTSTSGLKFTGLESTFIYNITVFGSDLSLTTVEYVIYGNSQTLNTLSNSSNTVSFNGIAPEGDDSDEILLNTGSGNAVINAVLIQAYGNDVLLTPGSFTAVPYSRTEIELKWTDNSANETGFEIFRRQLPDGSFMVVNTTLADDETFIDGSLTSGESYEYMIRAINDVAQSDYSSAVKTSTLDYEIQININASDSYNEASTGWNNTSILPDTGLEWADLIDDIGNSTTIGLQLVLFELGSANPVGMSSGIFPPKVIQSLYYVDEFNMSQWKLTGLNDGKLYDLAFFSSAQGGILDAFSNSAGLTDYEVNGTIQQLASRNNTDEKVIFRAINPNQSGEIDFDVSASIVNGTNHAIFNAMVVRVYNNPDATNDNNTYYSMNASDISQTASWNTDQEGTGTTLADFSTAELEMIVQPNYEIDITENINIDGAGTKVKMMGNALVNIDADVTSVYFSGLEVEPNSVVTFASFSPVQITIGNGGLVVGHNAVLDLGNNQLIVHSNDGVNTNNQSGLIAINQGDIQVNSSSILNSHLYFDPSNNQVKDLQVNNTASGRVQVDNQMYLNGILKMQAGSLDTRDNLVLVHDSPTNFAMIDKVEEGASIIGAVQYNRYWERTNGTYGVYHFGVPVKNQTFADWHGDFYIQGTDLTHGSWSNVSEFDETIYGYNQLNSGADLLTPGKGYSVFLFSRELGDGMVSYSNTGAPVIGDGMDQVMSNGEVFDFPITYTVQDPENIDNQGWNLVSNPYPAIIDLASSAIDWGIDGVFKAAFIYDSENQVYIEWDDSQGSQKVMPGQGFFIKAETANPHLRISEDAKVMNTDDATIYRIGEVADVLKINLIDENEKSSQTKIRFHEEATNGIDLLYDAPLFGGKTISSKEAVTNRDLLLNSLPINGHTSMIPISIHTKKEGSYALTTNENSFSKAIYFADKKNGMVQRIDDASLDYSFDLTTDTSSYIDRFYVITQEIPKLALGCKEAAYKGDLISMSVSSEDIENAELLHVEVSWDPESLKFVAFDSLNQFIENDQINIEKADQGKLVIHYEAAGNSLSRVDHLMNIQFETLVAGVEHEVKLSNSYIKVKSEFEYDLEFEMKDGLVSVFSERLHFGNITYKGNRILHDKKLRLYPEDKNFITDDNGDFKILLKENIDYSIDISEITHGEYLINIHDLVALNSHMTGAVILKDLVSLKSADLDSNLVVDMEDFKLLRDDFVGRFKNVESKQKWVADLKSANPNTDSDIKSARIDMIRFGDPELHLDLSILGDISDYEFEPGKKINYFDTIKLLMEPQFTTNEAFVMVSVNKMAELSGFQITLSWDQSTYKLKEVQPSLRGLEFVIDQGQGRVLFYWLGHGTINSSEIYSAVSALSFNKIGNDHMNNVLSVDYSSVQPIFVDSELDQVFVEFDNEVIGSSKLSLLNNYPNPLTDETHFEFVLKESSEVIFVVYNSLGEIVHSEQNDFVKGYNKYTWQPGSNCAKGVYLYKFQSNGSEINGKMLFR